MVPRIPKPTSAYAALEDQGGRKHELIDQAFKFSVAYLAERSFCLRLSDTITDGDLIDTAIYLQITPDLLDSLRFKFYQSIEGAPSHLDNVRRQLGGKGDLIRLSFQLRSGIHAQLIVPKDFPDHKALGSPARRTYNLIASLAASSSFALYLPANALHKELLNICVNAITQFSALTDKELYSHGRAVQLQRLYRGKGGKLVDTGDYDRPPANGQHNRSNSPAMSESDAATVDFDTVPRHQDSPPQYAESVTDREQFRAILNKAADCHGNSLLGCGLPKYDDIKQAHNVRNASKRVRQSGGEDVPQPRPKRVLSHGSFTKIPMTASAQNARCLGAEPTTQLDDAGVDDNVLLRALMRRVEQQDEQIERLRKTHESQQLGQEQRIKRLEDEIGKLRRQNMELEGRYRKVEDTCDVLEDQHTQVQDEMANFEIRIGELQGDCDELEQRMPTIHDVVEDLVRDKLEDCRSDFMKEGLDDLFSEFMAKEAEGSLAGRLREYVRKNVKDEVAIMKANMREALHR
ncbi:hypothetical protein K4K55_005212 [Colletotrichum sp. SAR 10_96]|nr:hypothetical protein K4K55_005212 [Colletotrichum sp. SAR 10_96]